ncbi:DUF4838 domain-containing protein [Paenibacillus eucommiae]|uniref:SLH domain-containing protein n=1 Tax=Paenibacillus eucommiae TaxID=1355755 RepID=A0ABS4J2P8_9BACL|nr:DUF4838 domain-containing protein [Paenibacillus eucommiae]MBP1993526.1 hypothetical protein [Paenibacillus eucommiae]
MKFRECGWKVVTAVLIFSMIFTSFAFTKVSAAFDTSILPAGGTKGQDSSDIEGHWAEAQLKKWLQEGLLQGYSNGDIAPDRRISRGEWIAFINRSFGFKEKGEMAFSDLSAADWQYEDVSIAVKAGYLSGYEDGTVRIENEISRQETAVMMERILTPYLANHTSYVVPAFTDEAAIAAWSHAAVQKLAEHKILGGYEDGSFKPAGSMTRAEAVTILDRALELSSSGTANKTFDQAGVYGSEDAAETITGNVIITTAGVTLRNMTILGDLLLAAGIGEGDVLLDRVTVRGETTVKGGGANSVHFRDSVLASAVIEKSKGTVRIVLEGGTTVGTVTVRSSVILEEALEGAEFIEGGFTNIKVATGLPEGSKVIFKGDFTTIDVEASNIIIELIQGVLDKLTVRTQAKGMQLRTEKDAKIILLELEAILKIVGQGTIEKAYMHEQAKGTTFEKPPLQLEGEGAPTSGSPISTGDGMGGETTQQPIKLIENGQSPAIVLVDAGADEQVLNAADTLVEYVRKSTGVELPIQTTAVEGLQAGVIRIYVGTSASEDQQQLNHLLAGLTGDGFVMVANDNRITIIGPTDWGTEFGVYEFLERYVGVRWLLPGPDGEDVPERSTISIPLGTIREQPAAISRQFWGTETITTNEFTIPSTNTEWARHNRIYENIQFHHNMKNLFDPVFFSQHPEYYVDGVIPTSPYDWQPCMNDTTAEVAIGRIIDYFDKNPDKQSYSLGVNDSKRFCEAKPDHPNYTGEINSIGYLNMSEIYYPWVNKIVEGVLAQHPDKYFGLLAYWNVYDPPTNVQLNPRVIPYITDDRMSWLDPAMGNLGKQHTEKWREAASNLAFYEYLYGSPYNVPRVYPQQMSEVYKYAKDHGVIAHVAELYPNFGEGAKPWLSAKLQWNPDLNVDDLLDEWYVRTVGAEAAPYLKQYYEYWEQFWTTRIFTTEWYLDWASSPERYNYLNLFDSSYLKAVTKEDMAASRLLMEQVVAKSQSDKQKVRAQKLMLAFEFYEASVLSYTYNDNAAVPSPTNEQEALTLLELMKDSGISMEMAKKRMELLEQFKDDPILNIPLHPPIYGGAWTGAREGIFSALVDWVETAPGSTAFMERLQELAESDQPFVRDNALLLLAIAKNKLNLITNPSFEIGSGGQASSWYYWTEGTGYTTRTQETVKSGQYSLVANGIFPVGGPMQDITTLEPGTYGAIVRYYTSADSVMEGTLQWYINLKDSNNQLIKSIVTEKTPVSPNKGKWTALETVFEVTGEISTVQFGFPLWYFKPGEKVFIDDVALYRLDAADDQAVITSVQAENGQIEAVFDREPAEVPEVSSFIIQQQMNNETAVSITPSAISWNEATRTATLTVPGVPASSIEQSVGYKVSYQHSTPVESLPFVVAPATNLTNLVANASFEIGDSGNLAQATSWSYWTEGSGWMSRTQAAVRSGEYSLVASDINPVGGPLQDISVEPGLYEAVVYYYVPINSTPNGTIQWYINLKDESDATLSSIVTERISLAGHEGTWVPLRTVFEVTAAVNKVQFGFPLYYFSAGEQLFIDDVGLYRLDN